MRARLARERPTNLGKEHRMQPSPEDAYFELSFSPNVRLVSSVRRFVSEFYTQMLADADITSRLAVATHELLENAVRYSLDSNTTIRIGMKRQASGYAVTIDTRNRAHAPNVDGVRRALDELAAATDAQQHYQVLMRRNMKRTDGSGLGLGRVRAESGMAVSYEIEDNVVRVRAQALFAPRVET
jgi:anti-sigma regulatory factor (Ser/Thr protein kinase)